MRKHLLALHGEPARNIARGMGWQGETPAAILMRSRMLA